MNDEQILDEFERRAMKLRDFMGYPTTDGVRVIEGVRALLAASASAEPMIFEQWASDPVRADKIPLAKHPNGAYSDTRSYLIHYGWKSALRYASPRPIEAPDNPQPVIADTAGAKPIHQECNVNGLWSDVPQDTYDNIMAGKYGDKSRLRTVYASPAIDAAPDNSQAVALSERVTQLQNGLETALEFIADATITEGQWHWVEEARAALSAPASMSAEPDGYAFRSDGKLWVTQSLAVAERWKAQGFEIVPVSSMTPENRPAIEASEHKPGCDALGGYGHGVGPCSCGAENRPAIEVSAEPTAGYYYHQGWEAAKARFKDATPSADDVRDAQRLNWLDARNEKFKMGWQVAVAPVGNVSVKSIVQLAGPIVSIREAIDAAIASQSAKEPE